MNKIYKFVPILAFSAGISLCSQALFAEETATTTEESAELATDLEAINTFGWMVAQQSVVQMQFNEAEIAEFLKGFKGGVANPSDPSSKQAELQKMGEYLTARMNSIQAEKTKEQTAKSETFFAELAQNPKVMKSDSGLYYEIIEAGEDLKATPEDDVTVHYTGTLVDGTVFDSSRDRGEPTTFPVSGVVPGFAEGVQLVGKGGKVKLYIPSNLGYGEQVRPGGPIPPNATLIFDVEMIEVKKGPAK